jgi:hypothetical protein
MNGQPNIQYRYTVYSKQLHKTYRVWWNRLHILAFNVLLYVEMEIQHLLQF